MKITGTKRLAITLDLKAILEIAREKFPVTIGDTATIESARWDEDAKALVIQVDETVLASST